MLPLGRGHTKTGFLWALAWDDRAWGSDDPPGVVYFYAPGRHGEHAGTFLTGFNGTLQIDAYPGYNRPTKPSRKGGESVIVTHFLDHTDLVRIAPVPTPRRVLDGQDLDLGRERKVDHNVGLIIASNVSSDGPRRRITVETLDPRLLRAAERLQFEGFQSKRDADCQSAPNIDPQSASKIDPFWHDGSWPDAV